MNTIWIAEKIAQLNAAWTALQTKPYIVKHVKNPFYFGSFQFGNGRKATGTIQQIVNPTDLRRFSRKVVPYRFINYLGNQIGRLAFDVVPLEGMKFTKKDLKKINRLKNFLRKPNPDMTWTQFISCVIEDMCAIGFTAIELHKLPSSEYPASLWPVDATTIAFDEDWRGHPNQPRYYQMQYRQYQKAKEIPFRTDELLVWNYRVITDRPFGIGPIEIVMDRIQSLINSHEFADRTASNTTPKKLLFFEGLGPEGVDMIRSYMANEVEGSGRLPVFGGEDTKAYSVELGMTTDQNLFLEWQKMLIALIANAFGVDVTKANLIVGLSRETTESVDDVTDEGSVAPLASLIGELITKDILPLFGLEDVAEFKFRFTTSMSDMKATAVVNQIEIQDDTLKVDEARARMGNPPLLHPITGENIGEMTVSMYREIIKNPKFLLKGFAGLKESDEENAELKESTSKFGDGENSNNTDPDQTKRGGNGVYSAPKIDDDD